MAQVRKSTKHLDFVGGLNPRAARVSTDNSKDDRYHAHSARISLMPDRPGGIQKPKEPRRHNTTYGVQAAEHHTSGFISASQNKHSLCSQATLSLFQSPQSLRCNRYARVGPTRSNLDAPVIL